MITATALAEQFQHRTVDEASEIKTKSGGGLVLRVCGFGAEAFLEWITEDGDTTGDVFDEIDEGELG